MAPLEGVTDRTYRSCFYDHFPGLTASLTPFLPIPDRVKRVPLSNLNGVCLPGESPVPEIPQLLVSESEAFLVALEALRRKGFKEVNWNMGCPSKGVIRKGKGSGLMPQTSHILNVLDEIIPRTDLKISVKLRMGLHDSDELFRLLPILKRYPLSRLILHPRLGTQMYSGSVDLEGFEKAQDLYGKAICYNGDINSIQDYFGLKNRLPLVEEWMIGRGLLANPFLLEDILNTPNSLESEGSLEGQDPFKRQEFYVFLDDLLFRMKESFTKKHALWNYMKGILNYTFSLPGVSEESRRELFSIKDERDWNLLKEKLYNQCQDQ
ncbi:tRNA-dihydrouridine synthase family protein [Oceanispirochaeta sp.]|jgi:tRNA-dihydrouridine synthase B|uniref:tRNA-dihydrouridine synthase family protein n=1 Tax=Oceanispirochaeta sp. TaxID=2035350 RepID=UPI002609D3B7|nr:tRNA-dihydrouridine synthase family protein [Oceanispirochaeta sp.]MDA3955436.1 tRNA-dihydrouridine synthase family protein [Oceanispirochaeta sp.]